MIFQIITKVAKSLSYNVNVHLVFPSNVYKHLIGDNYTILVRLNKLTVQVYLFNITFFFCEGRNAKTIES